MPSTITVIVLLFGYHTSTSTTSATSSPTSIFSGGTAGTTSGLGSPNSSSSRSATSGSGSSKSGSGSGSGSSLVELQGATGSPRTSTVTGSVASTQWGPVQVQLGMTGTTITKVWVLQYPNGNPTDSEINAYAFPILIKETLARHTAGIDMVTGATVTSTGYLQSLQSALDKAPA